jgi:uncharacterized protein DUF5753
MVLRESLDPDSSLWDWMAVDLYFYRTMRGLSCAQLGRHLKVNRQAVSNMEAGRYRLDETKAKILDTLWELNEHFQRLLRYARAGHDVNWFKAYVQYEPKATAISYYAALIIPGLLQTPEYAKALFVAGQAVEDIDAAVRARMARQEILTRKRPPHLWVLLKQSALEDPVGGANVMRAQLAHLLEAGKEPNIAIRVVPRALGAHVGLDGSFSIMTVSEGNAAYMEACGGGRLSLDTAEIDRFQLRFDRLGVEALSRDSTRSLITRVMENME